MSQELKYKIGGKKMTRLDAIAYYTGLAKKYSEPEKSAFLEMIKSEFQNDQQMDNKKSKWETVGFPLIGVALLLFSAYMAFLVPNPTQYQSGVLWVILSLAAGISAFMMGGGISYTNKLGIKAFGGGAVFCLMYFGVPAIYDKTGEQESKLSIYLTDSDSSLMQFFKADFNKNSSAYFTQAILEATKSYAGSLDTTNAFICYRKSDGMIYNREKCRDVRDYEVMLICKTACKQFPNERAAYTFFKKQADSLSAAK